MSTCPATLLLTFIFLVSASAFSQRTGGGTGGQGNTSRGGGTWDAVAHSNTFGTVVEQAKASDEGKIKFRSETTLIQVPVVVTDKSGNHIHGLSQADFRVLENGKEQKISTFEEKVSTTAKIPPPPSQPGQFSNLAISEEQPRVVTVVAIDTVNTPYLDQTIGRKALVKYLADNIDTSQVLALMIITTDGVKVVQGLSGDPEQLLRVLKKVSGELPVEIGGIEAQENAALGRIPATGDVQSTSLLQSLAAVQSFVNSSEAMAAQFQQARAIEITINAFREIAWSLSGIPGRKALIWATSGFPFVISSPDVVPGGFLSPVYERTMQALTDGQISVYPVDVRGLINSTGMALATPAGSSNPLSRASAPTQGEMNRRMWLHESTIQSLEEFADMTGGKAFYNTNDLSGSFKRAADDSSSYYLVGYYLDTKNNHAGWRQLKVAVDKKDTEIRARKGFFVTSATVQPDLMRAADIKAALSSPIEGTGVPVTLKWTGISGEGEKKKASFEILIPPNGVTLEGGDQSKLNFDIAVAAYRDNSKDDKPVLTQGQTVDTAVTPQQLAMVRAKGITISRNLEIGPGQYSVRLVIRDSATGKVGSVTAPLTVN